MSTSKLSVSKETKTDGEDHIEWDHFIHWDEPACKSLAELAFFACLNGPVDVEKRTAWSGFNGVFSVSDKFKLAGYRNPITNAAWKEFCMVVSQGIDCRLDYVKGSKIFKKYGKLWPDCANEYVRDELFRVLNDIQSEKAKTKQYTPTNPFRP